MTKGEQSALLYGGGKAPKRKGNAFEREVVNAARAYGLEAERAYASNGRSLGHHKEVDLVIRVPGIKELTVQAKRRRHLPGYINPATYQTDLVVLREDRGEALAVVPLKRLLELIT